MNIVERLQLPTPKLFQHIRTIGLVAASIGGVLITAPVVLPVLLVQLGGYLVVTGGVITAISQLTIDHDVIDESDTASGSHEV
ncbi:MAG: hypothetical protein J6O47_00885 [Algoriella sp.]|nr:hypothetical protein [Algoriella sp.]